MERHVPVPWSSIDDPRSAVFNLPGGYRDVAGRLHREVALAPLTGREEELLAARASGTPLAVLVTCALMACLRRVGPYRPVTGDIVRGLLAADRAYLLLKLRQLTFGDRIAAVLLCPVCGQRMDVDFFADQVPIEARRPAAGTATFDLSPSAAYTAPDGTIHQTVEFRLPTGEDQEIIALAHPAISEQQAVTVLLARCLRRLGAITPVDEQTAAHLGPITRREIEEQMERVSPSVDLDLEVTCPECGRAFLQPLEWSAAFRDEMSLQREQLYLEVHILALHYHWPESEILSLTRDKRRTYLTLLSGERGRDAALEGK